MVVRSNYNSSGYDDYNFGGLTTSNRMQSGGPTTVFEAASNENDFKMKALDNPDAYKSMSKTDVDANKENMKTSLFAGLLGKLGAKSIDSLFEKSGDGMDAEC